MKKFAALISIVMAVMFSAGLVVSAEMPGKVMLDSIQKSKPPVPFDHKAHAEKRAKDCKTCHHKDAAGKEQKCSACHKATAEGKTVSLKEAYHTTCKDCHKKDASKKAPVKCDGCHVK
ncbi:MAG TPA: cytochrome c3 family protein [Candidatus Limnocylindria bacterium]|nr:cytochrome c3 family protein [Candidatus Limnocylindria bacterium]